MNDEVDEHKNNGEKAVVLDAPQLAWFCQLFINESDIELTLITWNLLQIERDGHGHCTLLNKQIIPFEGSV